MKQQPAKIIRDGMLKCTIWENHSQKGVYYTISPARTYEKDGKLSDTNSYTQQELLRMAELMRQAYHLVLELRANAQQAPTTQAPSPSQS